MIAERYPEHVLGVYSTHPDGPLFVAIGAIHGNEHAGVEAIQTVLLTLNEQKMAFHGTFIGLLGTATAYAQLQRFITRDLNRKWFADALRNLRELLPEELVHEDHAQLALLDIVETLHQQAKQPIVFLDLHSTSALGQPFCGIADTIGNQRIAFALHVPIILGLEESIDGSMSGYLSDMGHKAITFEGGQHDAPETVLNHESALWLSLVANGHIKKQAIDFSCHQQRLLNARNGLPQMVEVRYRHAVTPVDQFVMRPGFVNFQPITKGMPLADDCNGVIKAPKSGLMLMPLYQSQGEDGFFIIRKVGLVWHWVSLMLRYLHADRLVPYLPGIQKHPDMPDYFIANTRTAAFYLTEVLHLFGYRRKQQMGEQIIFSRRRSNLQWNSPPKRLQFLK